MGLFGPFVDDEDDEMKSPRIARPGGGLGIPPVSLRGVTPPEPVQDAAKYQSVPQQKPDLPLAQPSAPPKPSQQQTDTDRAELGRLNSTGSGISQIKNPWARNSLRGLNIAGELASAVLPQVGSALRAIPGTEEHHNQLVGRATGRLNEDIGQQQKEAQTANLEAQPELKQAGLDLKQEQQNESAQKNENTLDAQYRKLGLKRGPDGNATPIPYEEMSPQEQAVHDLKSAQTEAADARAEVDRAKANPNSPAYQMQLKRLQIAEQNAKNAQARLGLSEAQFSNKLQEQDLVKPSGAAGSRGSAAQSVLQVMPELQQMVLKNAAQMGPLMGRLNRGEIAIGDVDPEVAKLYGAMKSFYALQPAVHGFRNAEFVKDFESAIGTLERDPKAFLAGMEGLKPTLEAVANEGKTFHHRIVEPAGGQNQPTQGFQVPAGAPAAPQEDGHTLKMKGKPVAVSKGGQWVAP